MKKKIAALIILSTFLFTSANASILGSNLINSNNITIGNGLELYSNTFISDQKGVGNQTEYYAEYTPNDSVVPTVVTGDAIYGKRTAKEIMTYMQNNNLVPMLGINASFFSLSSGIPMGHVITDGVVTSMDNRTLPGVGFNNDGTAFIDDLAIQTMISFGEDYKLQIPHLNKLIEKDTQMVTLYTSDFGKKTGVGTKALNIVLETGDNDIKIGEKFSAVISEVITTDEQLELSEGKMIISVNLEGNKWAILLLNSLKAGDEITFETIANKEIWNEASAGLASEGSRLLTDGIVNENLPSGAAPRTAIGVKEDKTVVLYVLDGRQTGYSYGAKEQSIAERLKELGCVDAINLDGGGSTTLAGVYPGIDENAIINSPSDNALRKVTNFIFLKNMTKPTGKARYAYIYPYSGKILSGSTISLDAKAVDENYYGVNSSSVEYSANEYGSVTQDGKLTALGEGEIIVNANIDGACGSAKFDTILSPTEIKIYNADTSKEIKNIDAKPEDSFRLYAKAFYNGIEMMSSKDAFRWSVSDEMASISDDGILTISPMAQKDITLTVSAGSYKRDYKIDLPDIVDTQKFYPTTTVDVLDDVLNIIMAAEYEGIDKDKSYFKIDGEKVNLSDCEIVETDEKNITISYPVTKDFHKVYVQTVTTGGYTDIETYKSGEITEENIFDDTASHWAKDVIAYMNSRGVVSGSLENGKRLYRPNNNVTRAEFAIMVSNLMGYVPQHYMSTSLDAFEDADTIPDWALGQVKAVYKNGIINGKDNNGKLYFEPNAYITRAEAATIISRILPKELIKNELQYKDVSDIPNWSLDAFKVLNASGLISGYDDNTLKPKNNVTRAEAVMMFYNIY